MLRAVEQMTDVARAEARERGAEVLESQLAGPDALDIGQGREHERAEPIAPTARPAMIEMRDEAGHRRARDLEVVDRLPVDLHELRRMDGKNESVPGVLPYTS